MIKSNRIGAVAAALMFVATMLAAMGMASPGTLASIASDVPLPYSTIMDKAEILSIEISAAEADWKSLLGDAREKEYIPANVTINGVTIKNVGIRTKGGSSLGAAREAGTGRYSLKIEFDHYIDGQTWLGLDKLCLNNMYSDNTYMKEYLSYDIMDYIGVDAPLFAYADISVNGEPLGFYLAVEAIEDSFLTRTSGEGGMLFKPEGSGEGAMLDDLGAGGNIIKQQRPGQVIMGGGNPAGDGNAIAGQQDPGQIIMDNEGPGQQINDNGGASEAAGPTNGQQGPMLTIMSEDDQGQRMRSGGEPGDTNGMRRVMMGGGSPANALQYTDDNTDSYATIFDNAVLDATEADYSRVIEALKHLNDGTDLETYVDVDAVLRYLAAHTVSVNLDSYISEMLHNYYLYEKDGRISILPWDYNMAFGGFSMGPASKIVNFPIDTPVDEGVDLSARPLISSLLAVPEYLEKYHQYLQEIIDGYFTSGVFERTFSDITALIDGYVKNDPTAFVSYNNYLKAVPMLKELILLRAGSIMGQLEGTIPATWEGQRADASALLNASAVTMSALGGDGGSISLLIDGIPLSLKSSDITERDALEKAVSVLQATDGSDLTEAQRAELYGIGMSDDQIERVRESIANAADSESKGASPDPAKHGGPVQMQGNVEPLHEMPEDGDDIIHVVVLGVCVVAVLLGILFVALYPRRK